MVSHPGERRPPLAEWIGTHQRQTLAKYSPLILSVLNGSAPRVEILWTLSDINWALSYFTADINTLWL